jgi:hypothetical protein
LPLGSLSTLPSRLQPASRRSSSARRRSRRSWPDPSETGGVTGSPKTLAGTCPRNRSRSASSSGEGLPTAFMSEFSKKDVVRRKIPNMMFWFVHSKSKTRPIASRMRGSLKASRRWLKYQPWIGAGESFGISSRFTRPSRMAGKS